MNAQSAATQGKWIRQRQRVTGVLGLLLACGGLFAGGNVHAQDYPVKSIRMVVPFPPGGFSDIYARIIGGKMHDSWNQQMGFLGKTVSPDNIHQHGKDRPARAATAVRSACASRSFA